MALKPPKDLQFCIYNKFTLEDSIIIWTGTKLKRKGKYVFNLFKLPKKIYQTYQLSRKKNLLELALFCNFGV